MKKITNKQINKTIADLGKKGGNVIGNTLDLFGDEQPVLSDYIRNADENLNIDERELLITTAVMGWYIVREVHGVDDEVGDDFIDARLSANLDLFNEIFDGKDAGPLRDFIAHENGQQVLMNFLVGLIVNRPEMYPGDIRDKALAPMIMHLKTVIDCLVLDELDEKESGEYSEEDFNESKKTVDALVVSYKKSGSYKKLKPVEKEEAQSIITGFGDIMYNHFLRKPADWTLGAAIKCCVEIMPRKFMVDDSFFQSVEPVLTSFLAFAAGKGAVPGGKRIAEGITGIGTAVMEKANDPESWGPGKVMLKEAADSGVDVTDKSELEAFIKKYNEGLKNSNVIEFPGGQKKPGRNDPCPCGSGKKYKKCCGAE